MLVAFDMVSSRVLNLVILIVFSTEIVSSFPAEYNAEYEQMEEASEQFFNVQLLSILDWVPCQGIEIPSGNSIYKYQTTIPFNPQTGQFFCSVESNKSSSIIAHGCTRIIENENYPNNHLAIYSADCGSGCNPIITRMNINLQEKVTYLDNDYCVDYVVIDPPIKPGHYNKHYCGNISEETHYFLNNTNQVRVWFRTSQVDNAYLGFDIHIKCTCSQTCAQENVITTCLKLASKPIKDNGHVIQKGENADYLPFDSLKELQNFVLLHYEQSTTLSISSHWSIVKLAIRSEKACDEEVKKAAKYALQLFSPSQIELARSLFA